MRRIKVDVKGGQLAGIAFGDPGRPVDSLFLHANGFNAITYQSLLAPLGLRAHVAGLDLRGHGRTDLEANLKRLTGWKTYCDDVIRALEQLAPEGCVLAGHSLGATTALLVAGKRPDLVTGLVLAEPVLLSSGVYKWSHVPGFPSLLKSTFHMSKIARARKNSFASPEDALEHLKSRPAFETWREPFLSDFTVDGLKQAEGSDDWQLSCAPAWEAATFGAQRHKPWTALKKVKCPIVIVRGARQSTLSPKMARHVMRIQPHTVILEPPGTSHFVPMERPYAVRDAISEFLARFVEGFEAGDEGRVQRNLNSMIGQKD